MKVRGSTGVTAAFALYVTAAAAYLLPHNGEAGPAGKCLSLAGAYVVVLLLWLVLRKREKGGKARA